ncbi:hypothetical protein HDU86_005353 [Geranomyces michiganensis]|nr:hypothetical protein HDU86_005353 [Geranomyces michiganensis]
MSDPYAAAVAAVVASATATASALATAAAVETTTPRNMDNVVQSNQATMLNGRPVYELSRVKDLLLRTSAATLLFCLLIVWAQTFTNKRSAVSLLVAATLATELIGVIVGLLPKISHLLPNTPAVSVVVGVGCFMFSAECFNWVLYLRFSVVAGAPVFAKAGRFTRAVVRAWLGVESLLVVANYAYWIQQAYALDGNTAAANDVYYYLSIVQAATALGLSSYFIAVYYYPRLKLTMTTTTTATAATTGGSNSNSNTSSGGGRQRRRRRGGGGGALSLCAQFATTGLLYLVLETLLHCSYTVTSKLVPSVRTGLTAFLTAARYATFMMFVLALRRDTAGARYHYHHHRQRQQERQMHRRGSRMLLPKLDAPHGFRDNHNDDDDDFGGADDLEMNLKHQQPPQQQPNQKQSQPHQQQQQRRRWPFFPTTASSSSNNNAAAHPRARDRANSRHHHNHHRRDHLRRHERMDPKGTFEDWSIDMDLADDATILRPVPAATTGAGGGGAIEMATAARAREFAR